MDKSNSAFVNRYGPWAVVAGASEGLGAEYATQLAQRGLNLVLVARRVELLRDLAEHLAREHQIETRILQLDLACPEAAGELIRFTEKLNVGLLVYNAAYSAVGPFLEHSVDDHLKEIDTNVRTPLQLIHAFGGRLLARGRGGVILMASLSALQGSAYIANYAATKAYTRLLAEGLWQEWRGRGVDVLVCMASAIKTPGYLASQPKSGLFSAPASEPRQVVTAALQALGHRPVEIPGSGNRLASFLMARLMPRTLAIRMMGSVMKGMYGS